MERVIPRPGIIHQQELELAHQIADYYANPLAFCLFAFPWGTGQLQGFSGPNRYQEKFLIDLGDEIRARRFDGVNPVNPAIMGIDPLTGLPPKDPLDKNPNQP